MSELSFRPFQVVIPGKEMQKLTAWTDWARQWGVLDDYLRALKTINYRLAYEPDEWGEPKYTLKALHLRIFLGTFMMLNVWYGVNDEHRKVYVKTFQFRMTYPFCPPPDVS